jgi:hypothetical protein
MLESRNALTAVAGGEFGTCRESPSTSSCPKKGQWFEASQMPANTRLRSATRVGRSRQSAFSPQLRRRTARLMTRKRPANAGLSRAAEGIRTLDLLHGKQNVQCRTKTAAKPRVCRQSAPATIPLRSPGNHGDWAPNGHASWPSRWLVGARPRRHEYQKASARMSNVARSTRR